MLADGALRFDATRGIATLASSNGMNHDGRPQAESSFTISGVDAHYLAARSTVFKLTVDAGANVGDAAQAAVSYDFDGNGTFDRTETWRYFATDDMTGWQVYGNDAGLESVSGATLRDLAGGAVKVELWTAIGSHAIQVDLAASSLDLPFQFGTSGPLPPPTTPVPQPDPGSPSDSTHFLVSSGPSGLKLSTPTEGVIASADGGHYIDQPHAALIFKADDLHGQFDGGSVAFGLPLDAGPGVGNGTQLRLSFDFDGNGATDRTESFQYFETNNLAGWESYSQARGLNGSSGFYSDFTGGSVTAEIWNAIGHSPVTLQEGASVILPFHDLSI